MMANWVKRTRSKTKGFDSFHAFRRCAIMLLHESMARAERQATAIGGSFMIARKVGENRRDGENVEDWLQDRL